MPVTQPSRIILDGRLSSGFDDLHGTRTIADPIQECRRESAGSKFGICDDRMQIIEISFNAVESRGRQRILELKDGGVSCVGVHNDFREHWIVERSDLRSVFDPRFAAHAGR